MTREELRDYVDEQRSMSNELTIKEAILLCKHEAYHYEIDRKRADAASGYTRSGNESIRTFEAKKCEERAKQFTQIAEWLDKYRQIRDIIQNYHDALYYEDIFALVVGMIREDVENDQDNSSDGV